MMRFILIFISLSVLMTLGFAFFGFESGQESYWDHHGVFLLIFLTFFPRLALIFSSIPFGGVFWWLGLIFCPHLLVAVLATVNYWNQNPILVSLAWFIALGAESFEKYYVQKTVRVRRVRYRSRNEDNVIDV